MSSYIAGSVLTFVSARLELMELASYFGLTKVHRWNLLGEKTSLDRWLWGGEDFTQSAFSMTLGHDWEIWPNSKAVPVIQDDW